MMKSIKYFDCDENRLKLLGELLSNESSRKIIKLLMEKECYTNEISNITDIRVNLVVHHLKKIEDLGLLKIKNKPIVKRGNNHRFFKMIPAILLTPNQSKQQSEKNGTLKNILIGKVKFYLIGLSGILTYFGISTTENIVNESSFASNSFISIDALIVSAIVVIFGLSIKKFKEKNNRIILR